MQNKTTTRLSLFTILILLFIVQACGPSADEIKQHDQALIDSAKKATEAELNAKQEALDSQKTQQLALKKRENDKSFINYTLIRLSTQLQVEQTKLQQIEQFHMLRTPAEKQQQLNQEATVVNSIKMKIVNLNDILQKINNGDDYTIASVQQ